MVSCAREVAEVLQQVAHTAAAGRLEAGSIASTRKPGHLCHMCHGIGKYTSGGVVFRFGSVLEVLGWERLGWGMGVGLLWKNNSPVRWTFLFCCTSGGCAQVFLHQHSVWYKNMPESMINYPKEVKATAAACMHPGGLVCIPR